MGEAPLAPTPSLPRAFGDYVLMELIAKGGMGQVYRAKTEGGPMGIERACVVKALRAEHGRDRSHVNRFIDEARLVVRLQHPNICHVFDAGQIDGEYFVAMEFIEGWTLGGIVARLLERRMSMPGDICLHLVAETLSALDYAHQLTDETGRPLQLVHRDVSLHNVMVDQAGTVKLVDFGIASSRLKVERTAPEMVLGKIAYMSPEQARGEGVDGRTDIFSAGVMLYEMFSGERFYQGLSTEAIWRVVGRGEYRPNRWAELPSDLQQVLERAIAGELSKRFSTAGEFEEALRELIVRTGRVVSPIQVRHLLSHVDGENKDQSQRHFTEATEALNVQAAHGLPHTKEEVSSDFTSSAETQTVPSSIYSKEPPTDEEQVRATEGAASVDQRVSRTTVAPVDSSPGQKTTDAGLRRHLVVDVDDEVLATRPAGVHMQHVVAAQRAFEQRHVQLNRRKVTLFGTLAAAMLVGAMIVGALWLKQNRAGRQSGGSPPGMMLDRAST